MVRDWRWRSPRSRSRIRARSPAMPLADITLVPYAADWKEATRLARNDAFRDHWGSLETPAERWSYFVDGPHLRPDLSWLAVEGDRVVALALGTRERGRLGGPGLLERLHRPHRRHARPPWPPPRARRHHGAAALGAGQRDSTRPCSTSTPRARRARTACTAGSASSRPSAWSPSSRTTDPAAAPRPVPGERPRALVWAQPRLAGALGIVACAMTAVDDARSVEPASSRSGDGG